MRTADGVWVCIPQAIAFAPACTLPLGRCAKYEQLIDSYVYASDVVPRLSLGSLRQLRKAVELAACGDDETLGRHLHECVRCPPADCRFPPGRLFLLPRCAGRARRWHGRRGAPAAVAIARPARRSLALIRLHTSMLRDHGFDRYERSVAGALKSRGVDL